ncbi:hypothetical protein SOASR014_37650 [Pectobacterium carotovorum subsp. carotovorum]|nr:hypothetical protein SOASR014_37650 [Pectobacterium carotovorum subsp. carotovorum]GLX46185.1 hypothetical protein Pcaca01_38530 [Pectobacterium carotovorum subsp. carotovorum]
MEGNDLKDFKRKVTNSDLVHVASNVRHLILWTERGAARHAKMLETDQAWEVFERLEEFYFSKKESSVIVQHERISIPTKPRALPRKLAKDNISRMPFINLHSETPHWAIPSVGGYFRGYEVGEAMAYLFLKFLNENRVPAEVGFKYYTDIMFSLFHRYELEGGHAAEVERSETEGFTSIRGQLAGFMNTTSKWLIVAANGMDNEARRFTEAQLLEKTNAALGSGVKALQFRV